MMFVAQKSTNDQIETAKKYCDGIRSATITDHNGQMLEGFLTYCTPPSAYDAPNHGVHIKGATKEEVRDLAGVKVRDASRALFADRIERGRAVMAGLTHEYKGQILSVVSADSSEVKILVGQDLVILTWKELKLASRGPIDFYKTIREDATSLLTYKRHLETRDS